MYIRWKVFLQVWSYILISVMSVDDRFITVASKIMLMLGYSSNGCTPSHVFCMEYICYVFTSLSLTYFHSCFIFVQPSRSRTEKPVFALMNLLYIMSC